MLESLFNVFLQDVQKMTASSFTFFKCLCFDVWAFIALRFPLSDPHPYLSFRFEKKQFAFEAIVKLMYDNIDRHSHNFYVIIL